jgi:hypothetical protein
MKNAEQCFEMLWRNHKERSQQCAGCQRLTMPFFRSARGDEMFNGDENPMGAGGDGALESDSNFIGNGEEAVFISP